MRPSVLLSACALVLIAVGTALALPPTTSTLKAPAPAAQSVDASRYVNANNLLGFVSNFGNIFYDAGQIFGKNDGLYFPYTDIGNISNGSINKSVIFDAGLWMGAKDQSNGNVLVTVADYSTEYVPGPMQNQTFLPDSPDFRVYKTFSDSLSVNPNADYLAWPVSQGAPVDQYGHPTLFGNQTLFSVYNDANPAQHTNAAGSTTPMGVEVRQTVWAESGPLVWDSLPSIREYSPTAAHPSPESVTVKVIDGPAITGHLYRIEVQPDSATGQSWQLIDILIGDTLLRNQPIPGQAQVDGMQVKISGPNTGIKSGEPGTPYAGWDVPSGTRRFTQLGGGSDLGLEGFRGTVGWTSPYSYYAGFPKVVPANKLKNVVLKLATVDSAGNYDPNDPNVSYGYRYLRRAATEPAEPQFAPFIVKPDLGYAFQDFTRSIPLSAWDTEANPPRRLTVGFMENNVVGGLVDGKYWPPYYALPNVNNAGVQREFLFIFDVDYSIVANSSLEGDALNDPLPIMYMAGWTNRDPEGWSSGDEFALYVYRGPSQVDSFSFAATRPTMEPFQHGTSRTIYVKYDLFNKGSKHLTDMYLGLWSDPDLGRAADDLVGCDTTAGIFYCYNSGPDDVYGDPTPAVGLRIEQGPIVAAPGGTANFFGKVRSNYRNLPPAAFAKFINGTDPGTAAQSYNYLRGLNSDGTPYNYEGTPTRFFNSGDPVAGTGDLDFSPADRRMLVSAGPFNFNPGDSQQIIVKWGVAQGTDALNSIALLKSEVLKDSSCCVGTTGNVNMVGIVDLSDLSLLINYLTGYGNPILPCPEEANVNALGIIDLADLSRLINYLTLPSPPVFPTCP